MFYTIVCHSQKMTVTCMSMAGGTLEVGNWSLSYSETDLDEKETSRHLPEKGMKTDSLGLL